MNKYLKSRLGTRMAVLFVLCALVPIVLLSLVAFVQVIGQLKEQARNQLRDESRAIAQAVVERLAFIDREFSLLGRIVSEGHDVAPFLVDALVSDGVQPFASVALGTQHKQQVLYGQPIPLPHFSSAQEAHLASGKTVIIPTVDHSRGRHLQLVRALPPEGDSPRLIRARVNSDYMWSALTEYKPAELSHLCVLDGEGRIIYTYAPMSAAFLKEVSRKVKAASVDLFDWREHGRTHFVSYRNIFLNYHYGISRLTVIAARPADLVLAPVEPFRRGFPMLVMLCIWVVLFLTLFEVRKRLGPLRKLIEGTRQIAEQKFDHRVDVASGDEFRELADSFNAMSGKIGRQLHTLNVIRDIDRGLLAAVEMNEIVGRALDGLSRVFDGRSIAIATLPGDRQNGTRVTVLEPGEVRPRVEVVGDLSERERVRLAAIPEGVRIALRERLPPYLTPIRQVGHGAFMVLPILVKDRIQGVISVGLGDEDMPEADAEHLHQVANQIALAMANANLVEALQRQNWGIVRALARAVDAKSSWTHGHSERVTALSLVIARNMGYESEALEELERGSLLHDIGKIGTSNTILDKPGPLTDEERLIIREHPRLGRRIIEPVGLSADILNIISQHHERYDGQGYPLGLSGETISVPARIVAVADVADAVAAKRPYRDAMIFSDVVALITRDAGKAFDPTVVAAFLRVAENADSLDALLGAAEAFGVEIASAGDNQKVGNTP